MTEREPFFFDQDDKARDGAIKGVEDDLRESVEKKNERMKDEG